MSICPAERRKAANQPEAFSADELKSLLALTRERFLGHFDVLPTEAALAQTDTVKAAGVVNGKGLITLTFLVEVVVCVALLLILILLIKILWAVLGKPKYILYI